EYHRLRIELLVRYANLPPDSAIDLGGLVEDLRELTIRRNTALHSFGAQTSMQTSIEQLHEWEVILVLTLVGAGVLANGFCEELGKQLAQRLVQRLFRGPTTVHAGDKATPLLSSADSRDPVKLSAALGVPQMANVKVIEIVRVLEIGPPGQST